MNVRGIGSLAFLSLTVLVAGCAVGPEGAEKPVLEVHLLSSFENEEQMVGWSGGEGVTVTRVGKEATAGARSLEVALPENVSAGLEYYPKEGDWSRFTSLRMDVVYPYEDRLTMAIRLDDAESSDYRTRYNRDDGTLALVPGRSEIELPMRALASGQPGCRGLDLRRIRALYLFPLGEHPERTFYVDNVRLEALNPEAFPSTKQIDGFEVAGELAWQPSEGVQVAPSEEHATEGERSLRVRFSQDAWPGISLTGVPQSWLLYDWLLFDVYNAAEDAMMLAVWVGDGAQKATVATALAPGENHIRIPLDLLSSLRLRTITGLGISVNQPASGTELFVDNIRLRRSESGPAPAEEAPGERPSATLELDYSALASVARDTGFLTNVHVKGEGGREQLIRIRPVEKGVAKHTVRVRPGRVIVSSFFLDDGTWFFDTRTVEVTEAGTVVRYEPGDFAH